ncbi:hypothetical protein EDD25_2966 [Cryobacterium psychrophilum]|nr:hypothetical protein EDD25_2966 [Cryobacterium psychrophilum]
MPVPQLIVAAVPLMLVLVACGQAPGDGTAPVPTDAADVASLENRLETIDAAVAQWRTASSLKAAHTAAEGAANLVVGRNGPGYGDRNGDGVIGGETVAGVLPGRDGTPAGLDTALASNRCVVNDVLGGARTDPAREWGQMLSTIDLWRPANNTMPSLGSHPMRIVGWATFTLESDSLDDVHEYAGHAKLHVDVSVRALDC